MAEIKYRAKSAEREVRRPLFKGLREGLWRVTTLSDCILLPMALDDRAS
jgi:hypothetical protein